MALRLSLALPVAVCVLLVAAYAVRAAAPRAERSGPMAVTLLAAGDLRGEIKPCGCSPEGQMGGLPRRLTYLARHLEGSGVPPILVDLGNNFPEPSEQGRLKAELIQKLLARFPPAAILPGPNELALGLSSLAPGLPYLVSNDGTGGPFLPWRTVSRAGRRIGLYGYLSPTLVYHGPQGRVSLQPVGPALLERLRRTIAREKQDEAVLLFRGSDAELATFLHAGLFAAIVAGNPSGNELHQVTERTVAGRTVPQVPTKGQGLLRIALPLGGSPGASGAVQSAPGGNAFTVAWLKDNLPDHPDAVAAFKHYDAQVKALFFARLKLEEKHRTESPYVGEAVCKGCHESAAAAWSRSLHSHALATLEGVGKQYDPECLACHVVGLNRGGFLSQGLTPQLANVQCENCHGPGRAHAADPKVKPGPVPSATGAHLTLPNETTCRTCHKGSHSPHFDFKVYWPKIQHGFSKFDRTVTPGGSARATSKGSR